MSTRTDWINVLRKNMFPKAKGVLVHTKKEDGTDSEKLCYCAIGQLMAAKEIPVVRSKELIDKTYYYFIYNGSSYAGTAPWDLVPAGIAENVARINDSFKGFDLVIQYLEGIDDWD